MKRASREVLAVLAAIVVGVVALVVLSVGSTAIYLSGASFRLGPVVAAATAIAVVAITAIAWRFTRRRLKLDGPVFAARTRTIVVALYVATWVFGVPQVVSDVAAWEISEYKKLRDDQNRVSESHPWIRFEVAFPIAPGLVLMRHEYALAGLYGWGGWELHAWYIFGSAPVIGLPQWVS